MLSAQRAVGRSEKLALLAEAYALNSALIAGLQACNGVDAASRAEELLKKLAELDYVKALEDDIFKKYTLECLDSRGVLG